MKHQRQHVWTIVVFAGMLLFFTSLFVQADNLTLRTAFRDPAGVTGTVAFTVELESSPISASTPAPMASSVPESSTLVLVGLGVVGLAILGKARYKAR